MTKRAYRRTPGSPPQVRGKHGQWNICPRWTRITPAGAGKTGILLLHVVAAEDHPRRCGENLRAGRLVDYSAGITPAGAGKTIIHHRMHSESRDHPRRCGENTESKRRLTANRGSPPQVRGKPPPLSAPSVISGITPAGAGKTSAGCWSHSIVQDHPRRCGENVCVCID